MFFCVIVFKMGFSVVFKSWMVDNLSEFFTNVWHHFVFVINPVFPLLKMKWLVWLTQHNCICKQCFSNYDKISVFPLGVFQLWRQDFFYGDLSITSGIISMTNVVSAVLQLEIILAIRACVLIFSVHAQNFLHALK